MINPKNWRFMRGKTPNFNFPTYFFTMEELEELFIKHGIEPIKKIGKPTPTPMDDCLDIAEIYDKFLELELKYSSLPSIASRGAHIAMVGKKPLRFKTFEAG